MQSHEICDALLLIVAHFIYKPILRAAVSTYSSILMTLVDTSANNRDRDERDFSRPHTRTQYHRIQMAKIVCKSAEAASPVRFRDLHKTNGACVCVRVRVI